MSEPEQRGVSAIALWHLVWLGYVVVQPVFDERQQLWQWVLAGAIVAVFVPVYLLAQLRDDVHRLAPWVAIVLGTITSGFNSGAAVLFVYAAVFVSAREPRRVVLRWLVAISVLIVAVSMFGWVPLPWSLLSFAPVFVLSWVLGMIGVEHREDERLRRLQTAQVEHLATLSERERIARDLHDLLGQTLTGIVVRSQLAQRIVRTDTDAGVREMAEVEGIARAALTEVRATVSGWRQIDLDAELAVARDALTAAGVEVVVDREPGLELTPSGETALGLALREGVTNVVRHAHAHRCTVTLRRCDGDVVLEIADDGVGGGPTEGNGLRGMRERIGALGGAVDRLGRDGTALTVSVPATVAT